MLRLPGLIDPHVHLRDPGATHKEDFDSGTAAALAGGYTAVLAMPNTDPPLTDAPTLRQAEEAARRGARCDYGIFLGAGDDNSGEAAGVSGRVCGLKVYMDATYGPLRMRSLPALVEHFRQWPSERPIAVHAEGHSLLVVLGLAQLYRQRLHVCHVSRAIELQLIRLAKQRGAAVTCEVTPHHLFLTAGDLVGGRSAVRPSLAAPADREALWAGLDLIDCIATDHAPHTPAEKDSDQPPPGFPGLETALGLLLGAVAQRRLSLDQLIDRMHTNPRQIFGLPRQPETWIELDPDTTWPARAAEMHSRCAWTPYEGRQMLGRIRRVVLRGQPAYLDGELLSPPGAGANLLARPIPA